MSVYERVLGLCMNSVDPANPNLKARIINGESFLGPDDAPKSITLADGDHIKDSNFSQAVPLSLPLAYKGLTFESCNLLNIRLPEDGNHKVIDSLWIEKSFCSHLHPDMIAAGLPECEENCQHRSTTDPTMYHDITTGRHIGCAVEMDTKEIAEEDRLPPAPLEGGK